MSWWQSGSVNCSQYKIAHLSDAVRLALLYKYGGFYSDTDTITLKSFSDLINYNGFGVLDENGEALGLGNYFAKATRRPLYSLFLNFYDLYFLTIEYQNNCRQWIYGLWKGKTPISTKFNVFFY